MPSTRYDVVRCVVTKHVRYGVLVDIDTGERGWIDDDDLTEGVVNPSIWPQPGTRLTAVVLHVTRDGRVGLSALPKFVELVGEAVDPAKAVAALTPSEVWRIRGLPEPDQPVQR